MEYKNKNQKNNATIFSKIGLSAKTVIFTVHRTEISYFHSIQFGEIWHYITDILPEGVHMQIITAEVQRIECKVLRQGEEILDEHNRPQETEEDFLTFPAVLTEKYLKYAQDEVHGENDLTFVLVTPKEIQLIPGDLVEISGDFYNVRICHTLDEYKNEYEIQREKDV